MRNLVERFYYKNEVDGKLPYEALSIYNRIVEASFIITFLEENFPEQDEWISIYKAQLEVIEEVCKL